MVRASPSSYTLLKHANNAEGNSVDAYGLPDRALFTENQAIPQPYDTSGASSNLRIVSHKDNGHAPILAKQYSRQVHCGMIPLQNAESGEDQMPRQVRLRELTEAEKCEVGRIVNSRTEPVRRVQRAKII